MWYEIPKQAWLNLLDRIDFYAARKSTDDPAVPVVKLRNAIIDLIEGKTNEIMGATDAEEIYIFFGGYNMKRYTLARIYKGKSKEYTFFPDGWPTYPQVKSIKPDHLVIQGTPYKITKESDQLSQVVLKLETNRG